MQLNTYLTFNGNCREAMSFYKDCLGGNLRFQTVGESPFSEQMPARMKETILHATLISGKLILMASDMISERGLTRGNAVSLMLNCSSETEITEVYNKLSRGGQKSHTPELTGWGALFGDLTDKYGNHWLLHCPLKG